MKLNAGQRGAVFGKGGKWAAEGPIPPMGSVKPLAPFSTMGGKAPKGYSATIKPMPPRK